MRKELLDGIIIDKSYLMVDEKKPGFRIPARVIQLFAIIIGSYSAFSILFQSLSAPVNGYGINAVIFICSVVMLLLCIYRSYDWVKLILVSLFYILFLCSKLSELKNGFYLIENLVITRLSSTYGYIGFYYVANRATETADITLLVSMVMIPAIALFAVAVVRYKLINLCSLILLFPVAGSFLLGIIPAEKYLIAYLVTILYLVKSGLPFRHSMNVEQRTLLHRISSRAAVWISLICLVVFLILKLFIPEEQYTNIAQLNAMKTKVTEIFTQTSIQDISSKITDYKLFDYEPITGGLRGGKLGRDGKVTYTGEEQLVIHAPQLFVNQGIYLKGYVGCEYTGKSWDGHTDEDKQKYNELLKQLQDKTFDPINQMNLWLGLISQTPRNVFSTNISNGVGVVIASSNYQIQKEKMQVEYKAANRKYIYAPYYTDFSQLDNIKEQQDLYAMPYVRRDHYELDYYYDFISGSEGTAMDMNSEIRDYSEAEKFYRDYVYDTYTRLPATGLERLRKDFSTKELKELHLNQKLGYVKNYLKDNTTYTLSPGKLPKGKDFVEYFLYENKKGYCAHYASAAVLMLRAMGVPARYVEGYAIADRSKEDSFETVIVRDKNAHAWVEIYMDGCGWIPVEFTPGAAIEYNTKEIESLSWAKKYLARSEGEPEATFTPSLTPEAQKPDQRLIEVMKQKHAAEEAAAYAARKEKLDKVFVLIFLILVATTAGISGLCILMRRRKLRSNVSNVTHNNRALLTFSETEKILIAGKCLPKRKARLEDYEDYVKEHISYIDAKEFSDYMDIVKKARFGRDSITDGELKQVKEYRERLFHEVYTRLPLHKKLVLKLCLLLF